MSGVYIKGFQLPEKNDLYYVKVECKPGKNPVATIWRKDLLGEMSFGAFEVIPVPPHGDLIDRDAYCYSGDFMDEPVIIPKEDSKADFCEDCHWYDDEYQYCFRQGNHSYDESSCELWEPKGEKE